MERCPATLVYKASLTSIVGSGPIKEDPVGSLLSQGSTQTAHQERSTSLLLGYALCPLSQGSPGDMLALGELVLEACISAAPRTDR